MADELQAFREAIEKEAEEKQKIREALDQAQLDQRTLEHLCERIEWLEKIANSLYLLQCEMLQGQHSLLEILGKRLRKDSEKLNMLQDEIQKRRTDNGTRDLLMEVKAGGDVKIDQSRKVPDDEKSES